MYPERFDSATATPTTTATTVTKAAAMTISSAFRDIRPQQYLRYGGSTRSILATTGARNGALLLLLDLAPAAVFAESSKPPTGFLAMC